MPQCIWCDMTRSAMLSRRGANPRSAPRDHSGSWPGAAGRGQAGWREGGGSAPPSRLCRSPCSAIQSIIENRERLIELRLGRDERREEPYDIAVDATLDDQETADAGLVDDALRQRRIRRFPGAVRDDFHGEHETEPADLADALILLLQLLEAVAHPGRETLSPCQELLLLESLDDHESRCAGQGIAAIGAAEAARSRGIHDLRLPDDAGDRQAACKALRNGDEVRLNPRMLEAEHFARAAEPGLDLVDDQDDPVAGR